MRTAFSKIFTRFTNLWRTVVSYVCKIVKRHVAIEDVTGDNRKDIVITTDSEWVSEQTSASVCTDYKSNPENLLDTKEVNYDK